MNTFDEFIGNVAAVRRLRATLSDERHTPVRCHAYLLTGPSQVGKGTLARAMAAALVCTWPGEVGPSASGVDHQGPPSEAAAVPCGACRACRLVARAGHTDVRIVEAESGRRGVTIEQIRQLEHDAALRPYEATRKVFIVAGVEAMTEAAANALLKTLEEPPADTVLVLTADDVSQVLPTIVSRCREVPLRAVPASEIEAALIGRGVAAEPARVLARLSAGRAGWAIAAVADSGRVTTHTQRIDLLETLLSQPRRQRLPAAADMGDAAAVKSVLDVWLGWWRDALLVQQDLPDLVTNTERVDQLRHLGAGHPPEAVWRALTRIQETRQQVDANVNVRLAVEALLLDLPERS
ncbi:MAG: hypothetical protein M3442_06195 [Chloroflexota bacterium]|nr:hypothetical protein [Chloroflexota bacterium]